MDLLVLATMKNAANCDNVIWIAEFDESSTFWTHIAPKGPSPFGMLGWGSLFYHNTLHCKRCERWTMDVWTLTGLIVLRITTAATDRSKPIQGVEEVGLKLPAYRSTWREVFFNCEAANSTSLFWPQLDARRPAEFKHITKRRKRN